MDHECSAAGGLAEAYRRHPSALVAFIDESYELGHRGTFCVMAAVVAPKARLDDLRAAVHTVVGGSYWHTTEALRTPPGQQRALDLAELMARVVGGCLLVHRRWVDPGDSSGDRARRQCLEVLVHTLCAGRPPLAGATTLLILEQRNTRRARAYDALIVREMRKAGTIDRQTRLVQASPADEHLLWLPDLACSAFRRVIVRRDRRLIDPLRAVTHVVGVRTLPQPPDGQPPAEQPRAGRPLKRSSPGPP